MAVELGDLLLVPWCEFKILRGPEDLREFLARRGDLDDDELDRHLDELGVGPTVAVLRRRPFVGAAAPRSVVPRLRELPPVPTSRPVRKPRPVEPEPEPEAAQWIDLTVFTDDGVRIADAQLEIADDWGFSRKVATDANGHLRIDTEVEWPHHVRVAAAIELPPPPAEVAATAGLPLLRTPGEPLRLSTGSPHVLIVPRPRAEIIAMDGWSEARSVLVFGAMHDTPDGPATIRGALRTLLCAANRGELHVVGHSDTEGKHADNEALALERAKSVHLFLAGRRDDWAQHAFANADVATLQAALKWAAAACALACDPGEIDGDWGPQTANALTALREHAAIDQRQPLGPDDWAAIHDLYDEDLQRILLTDAAGLADARARMVLAEPESMGERWPVEAPELEDHECPSNRRVELVMCAPGAVPEPGSDELYDDTFVRTHIAVAPEAQVRLRTVTTAMVSPGRSRMALSVGPIAAELTSDEAGLVELTALRGDSIVVLACTDAASTSRFVWGTFAQQAAQEAS